MNGIKEKKIEVCGNVGGSQIVNLAAIIICMYLKLHCKIKK